jgi:hypothetical protein
MNISGSLYVSSFDRNQQLYDYNNATYQIPNLQSLSSMALYSFDFVYGINNINVNNRTSYFVTSTQSFNPTLATGDYDYTSLATQVLAVLNGLGLGVFTLTFTNDIYTLTSPVPISFITNITGRRDWVDMLGLVRNTPLQTVFVGGVANIAYTDAIFITCDELHRKQTVRDQSTSTAGQISSVLGVVYVNKNERMSKTDVLTHIVEPKHITDRIRVPKYTNMDLNYRINTITIRLLDQQGFDLPPTSAGNGSCQYILEIGCMNQEPLGM